MEKAERAARVRGKSLLGREDEKGKSKLGPSRKGQSHGRCPLKMK